MQWCLLYSVLSLPWDHLHSRGPNISAVFKINNIILPLKINVVKCIMFLVSCYRVHDVSCIRGLSQIEIDHS